MSYGVFSSVYDILTENIDYKKIADKICSLLSLNGVDGGLLLDLGCGTGTLSFLLEENGYDIIGADASEDMLAEANKKKYENNSSALFLCQTMEELDLYGTVDCAVCCLDTVNHLSDIKKVYEAFRRVSLFMNMDGVFIFDINTVHKHRDILADNTFVYDMDDVYCVWQNTYDGDNKKTSIELDFFVRDEDDTYSRYSESFCEYAYGIDEILSILEKCGFTLIGCYDDYSDGKVTDSTQRITVAAKKTGLIYKDEVK